MITSFSFPETMLKCVCLFLGMVSMFLSHFGAVNSGVGFFIVWLFISLRITYYAFSFQGQMLAFVSVHLF